MSRLHDLRILLGIVAMIASPTLHAQDIPVAPAVPAPTPNIPVAPVAPASPEPTIPVAPIAPTAAPVVAPTAAPAPSPTATPKLTPSPVATPTRSPAIGGPVVLPSPAVAPSPTPAAPNFTLVSPNPAAFVVTTPEASLFQQSQVAYQQQQYEMAIKLLSKFAGLYPSSGRREQILFQLGDCYRSLNLTKDALAAFDYQVKTYPDGPFRINAELFRGQILYNNHDLIGAQTAFQIVLDRGEGDFKTAATYFIAQCLLSQTTMTAADKDRAEQLLKSLAELDPPCRYSAPAALLLAAEQDQDSDSKNAFANWEVTLKLSTDPTVQAYAAAHGGWSALQTGDTTDAYGLFVRALAMPQATPELKQIANTGLLRLAFQKQEYDRWLQTYTAQPDLILDEYKPEIASQLGQVKFALKDWPGAVTAFDAYLKAYPNSPGAPVIAFYEVLAKIRIDSAKTVDLTQGYLKAWPGSKYQAKAQLILAGELSHQGRWAEAAPVWEELAKPIGRAEVTLKDVRLQLATCYNNVKNWPQAIQNYQDYLAICDRDTSLASDLTVLRARERLGVCLQDANRIPEATLVWQKVLADAGPGSPEQEAAMESLGLIYTKDSAQSDAAAQIFTQLLTKFPKTKLRAIAEFGVGNNLFSKKKYEEAIPYLKRACAADVAWIQPATLRLALSAYALHDLASTEGFVLQYDSLPLPTDPAEAAKARLPVDIYYWMAQQEKQAGRLSQAAANYSKVIASPDAGKFLSASWRLLADVQLQQGQYSQAVTSYDTYAKLEPDQLKNPDLLISTARAHIGTGDFKTAQELGHKALTIEPEGPDTPQILLLLADIALGEKDYPRAAKQYAQIPVLFPSDATAPQALDRAAEAYDLAGDSQNAEDCRKRLKTNFPSFSPSPAK